MQIPHWPQSGDQELTLLQQVLNSPQWGGFHPFITEFENRFAAFQGCSLPIAAMNGTVTLEIALSALDIGPGDEVIVPAISFISTATAVSRVGAAPVFVDLEPWSFNLDPEKVCLAISPRTKAVIAVHFGGAPCRIDDLLDICTQYGLALIEDAAHAHGAEWNGCGVGSFGKLGSFSFQNGKVLCSGEGGLLVTSDPALAERLRSLINQGRLAGRPFFEHHRLGTNFRMTAFQAAILLAQLERLPVQIEQRTANANRLRSRIGSQEGIIWQHQPPKITRNPQYLLAGRLQNAAISRDELCQALTSAGVPCTPFYPHTLYGNPLYAAGGCRIMPCPNSEAYLRDAFWLPHRVLLAGKDTIDEIADLLENLLAGKLPATEKKIPGLEVQTASHPGGPS